MGWDLRDPFCLWATLPHASPGGLQGLGHGMGERGLEGWRPGRGEGDSPRSKLWNRRPGCTCAVASGLGGEEQAGELPAAAVSVHER